VEAMEGLTIVLIVVVVTAVLGMAVAIVCAVKMCVKQEP